mmetsp:Transcript_58912/g.67112  ORF Transcript_58912/g.67112 Transcript_58912/m.67112 type:complete len:267 (+) Transcript_58912:28-828(+)
MKVRFSLLTFVVYVSLVTSYTEKPAIPFVKLSGDLVHANEGINNDGENFYLSGRQLLFKTDLDLNILDKNSSPLSIWHRLQGLNHIGDFEYYDGTLILPIERQPFYMWPALARFDATDLTMIEYKSQSAQHHMPWVALDKNTKFLFSSEFDDVDTLQIYDLDLKHRGSLPLAQKLPNGIQGGTFGPTPGLLYLTCNTNESIWEIDIVTGAVKEIVSYNNLGYTLEMEGITYFDLSQRGEGVLHFTGNPQKSLASKKMFNLNIPQED